MNQITDKAYMKICQKIGESISERNYANSATLVNELNKLYPNDQLAQHLWLLIASLTKNYEQVIEFGPAILENDSDLLRRAKGAFTISNSHWENGELTESMRYQDVSLFYFSLALQEGKCSSIAPSSYLSVSAVENASERLKEVLNILENNEVIAVPFYGTLLGLIRDGELIKNDKDIDIMVHMDNFNRTEGILKSIGLERDRARKFANFQVYLDFKTGLTFDFNFYFTEEFKSFTGFYKELPDSDRNYIQWFDEFDFERKYIPCMKEDILMPKDASKILRRLYGMNWKIKDPDWMIFIDDESKIDNVASDYLSKNYLLGLIDAGKTVAALKACEKLMTHSPYAGLIRNTHSALKHYNEKH